MLLISCYRATADSGCRKPHGSSTLNGRSNKMEIKIDLLDSPTEKDQAVLNDRFSEYLRIQYPDLPPESEDKKFMVVAHDEVGDYIGAIGCNCYWDGLELIPFGSRNLIAVKKSVLCCWKKQKRLAPTMGQSSPS